MTCSAVFWTTSATLETHVPFQIHLSASAFSQHPDTSLALQSLEVHFSDQRTPVVMRHAADDTAIPSSDDEDGVQRISLGRLPLADEEGGDREESKDRTANLSLGLADRVLQGVATCESAHNLEVSITCTYMKNFGYRPYANEGSCEEG